MRTAPVLLDDGTWVDAIIGYRCWRPWAHHGIVELSAVATTNMVWETGINTAICSAGAWAAKALNTSEFFAHTPPKSRCGCGFWAYNDFARLLTEYPAPHYLRGEVYLWGTIKRHDLGYRAQFAKVACIYESDDDPNDPAHTLMSFQARLAAKHYDVPLVRSEIPNISRSKRMTKQEEMVLRGLSLRATVTPDSKEVNTIV